MLRVILAFVEVVRTIIVYFRTELIRRCEGKDTVGRMSQLGIFERLSCCGIHHDIAFLVVRLCLYDDADTGNKVQHASDLCLLLGAEHQHIDAGRQTVQFERVLEDLVAGMTGKGKCPGVFFQQGGRFLNLPQVFLPVDIQLGITRQRGAIDMHGQAFDVAQVGQVNHLRLVHLLYRCGDVHLIARIVQRSPFVAQLISAFPCSPALQ